MFSLQNRIAIVTGAGRGIGRAIAIALAGAGAQIGVTARTASELDDTVQAVAKSGGQAVAIVADGCDVGIDIERIEPRTDNFTNIAFTSGEIALGDGRNLDEWLTRVWAAKEAVGKARGTGVTNPKQLEVRAVDGDRLTIEYDVVDTRREGDYVVAWTRRNLS